jgi:2',3'-cyclic-nucleotide 2'-phosphodiesterase (5'-nucleotidase family)
MLLSSGDMWQGGALSNETYGELMVNWMNIAGFESMAIGNHEFDWTADYIARNSAIANFPFLGINILDGNNIRPAWAQPSLVVQRGRYKIGVIGAIGQLENSIAASSLGDYHFASNFPSLVSTEATRLRAKEGCDLVVLSLHDSSFDTSLCQNIDAVFEGHTHQDYESIDSYGIPHVQCYANGSEFQKVHFEEIDGKLKFVSYTREDFGLVSAVPEEPMTKGIYDYYYAQHPEINEVVGHTDTLISETDLANISAKALCEYYKNDDWNSDMNAGILNWGGVRQTIPAGDITYAEVYAALPFDNDNVLCSLTGDNFKKICGYSSSLAVYSTVASAGIDSSKTYYAMIISYISDYDYYSTLLTQIKRDTTMRLRDIVADYFKAGENV